MSIQFANNAVSLLAAPISASATSLQITSGDEFRFPVANGSDKWFVVTVIDNSGNREIMKCSLRSGVTLTVSRKWEGPTQIGFAAGARVECRLTAQSIVEATSDAATLTTGVLADGRLPPRLRASEVNLGVAPDANDVTESGNYWLASAADNNAPITGAHGFLSCDVISTSIQLQEWNRYDIDECYRRRKIGGVWSVWQRIWTSKPDDIPIGTIMDYAGIIDTTHAVPAGWAACYGQHVNRTGTYAALFAVISTTYNSTSPVQPVAASQFALPDLRGRVVAGQDDMGGASANRLTGQSQSLGGMSNGDVLGAVGGVQNHVLTEAQLATHDHSLASTTAKTKTGDGDHTHTIPGRLASDLSGYGFGAGSGAPVLDNQVTGGSGDHVHTLVGDTKSAGSNVAHNNVQPTIILNKIIRYV